MLKYNVKKPEVCFIDKVHFSKETNLNIDFMPICQNTVMLLVLYQQIKKNSGSANPENSDLVSSTPATDPSGTPPNLL